MRLFKKGTLVNLTEKHVLENEIFEVLYTELKEVKKIDEDGDLVTFLTRVYIIKSLKSDAIITVPEHFIKEVEC